MKNTENALEFLELKKKDGIENSDEKQRLDQLFGALSSSGINPNSNESTMMEQAFIADNLSLVERYCAKASQVQKDKHHVHKGNASKHRREYEQIKRKLSRAGITINDPKHLRSIVAIIQANKRRYERAHNRPRTSYKIQQKAEMRKSRVALETAVASFADEAFDLKLYEPHLSDAYIDCQLRQAAVG